VASFSRGVDFTQRTMGLHPRLKVPGLGPRATGNAHVADVMSRVTGVPGEHHNEKWRETMAVQIDQEKCNGCGLCVEVCPVQAISIENNKAKVDKDTCVECGQCVDECPNKAISTL